MKGFLVLVVSVLTLNTSWASDKPPDKDVTIITANSSPRIKYGAEKLTGALRSAGYKVTRFQQSLNQLLPASPLLPVTMVRPLLKAVANYRLTPDTTGKKAFQ